MATTPETVTLVVLALVPWAVWQQIETMAQPKEPRKTQPQSRSITFLSKNFIYVNEYLVKMPN
jgi:hypothetical protein